MTVVYLVEPCPEAPAAVAFLVWIEDGTLHLGDVLSVATDPDGRRHPVALECREIHLFKTKTWTEIWRGWNGMVEFTGDAGPAGAGWTLSDG